MEETINRIKLISINFVDKDFGSLFPGILNSIQILLNHRVIKQKKRTMSL